MLEDTPENRRFIRYVIWILSSYGPFCLAYTTWVLAARFWHPLSFGRNYFLNNTVLWILWAPEAVFYLFFLAYGLYLQRAATHPPLRSQQERSASFNKVRSEIYDPVLFLSGWFRGSPIDSIGRDELRRFVDWSFFEGRAGANGDKADKMEVEGYIQEIEKMVSHKFPEGRGKAKSLRLTIDPIEVEARSLLWYTLIMTADTLAITGLISQRFEYHRRSLARLAAVFPPRPAALLSRHVSAVPDFSYFLKRHTSRTRLPIVYLHGIGIGLVTALGFLDELNKSLNVGAPEDDQVGVLVLEVLQISSRLTTPIPRRAEFLAQLTSIIDTQFGLGRFVLMAHSYGSVLSTHILNDPHLSPRVSAALLVDPVSILLHMPSVAYNFTIRAPVRANEWQLWYFASKDPSIAHTLGRHFFWSENVLWRDRIDYLINNHNMRFTASLGSDDLIVDTKAVKAYLADRDLPDPTVVEGPNGQKQMQLRLYVDGRKKIPPWVGKGLELLWWDGYDHATVFDEQQDRARLIEVLAEYARGS